MRENCLLVFYKPPIVGKVKSRLAKSIGADRAASVYAAILRDIASEIQEVDADVLPYSLMPLKSDIDYYDPWPNHRSQSSGNLGNRMLNAFRDAKTIGYRRVVLCGTDIPLLTAEILNNSFTFLQRFDMVLGPTYDGGYYLIGISSRRVDTSLFSGISWSTGEVFDQTISKAGEIGLSLESTPLLRDLDNFEDGEAIDHDTQNNRSSRFSQEWSR